MVTRPACQVVVAHEGNAAAGNVLKGHCRHRAPQEPDKLEVLFELGQRQDDPAHPALEDHLHRRAAGLGGRAASQQDGLAIEVLLVLHPDRHPDQAGVADVGD